ncbi:MAG: hypothetical protein MUE44_34750 [Oscillatoriaceae cyanobacterium Prado104]|jgi:hypothetical protein|nr:hypothetical protein [Oscillatoriaceae cyanobacterium Prado104]
MAQSKCYLVNLGFGMLKSYVTVEGQKRFSSASIEYILGYPEGSIDGRSITQETIQDGDELVKTVSNKQFIEILVSEASQQLLELKRLTYQ